MVLIYPAEKLAAYMNWMDNEAFVVFFYFFTATFVYAWYSLILFFNQ